MLARRDHSGFTLVEVLAAVMVFSIVTLGVVPLITSSLRGSNRARAFTIGKNVATEAMERVRGLPFYVEHEAAAGRDLDVLDLYHPGPPNDGAFYRISCPAAGAPACPSTLPNTPPGLSITFRSRFVGAGGTQTVPTPSTYDSDPDQVGETDEPPSLVLEMAITTRWNTLDAASPDRFQLKTLLGDRKIAGTRISSISRIDYVVRALTSYQPDVGTRSSLTVLDGVADARVRAGTGISARSGTQSASLTLVPTDSPDAPPIDQDELEPVSIAAPPSADPPPESAAGQTITDLLLGNVAGVDASIVGPVTPVEADVKALGEANDLRSQAGFVYSGGVSEDLWVEKPEVATGPTSLHRLSATRLVSAQADATTGVGVSGFATAATDSTVDTSAVTGSVQVGVEQLRLLPAGFVTDNTYGGAAIVVEDFVARVRCDTGAGLVAPTATATWSATLRFWQETDPNDGVPAGAYRVQSISGSSGTASFIAGLKTNPPMLFEERETTPNKKRQAGDIYMFPVGTNPAYLNDFRAQTVANVSVQADDALARLSGAIAIDTVAFPSATAQRYSPTPVNLSLGALSCAAEDSR